jgi:hypothetical protein
MRDMDELFATCRKCLERWHHIPTSKSALRGNKKQIDYIVEVNKRVLVSQSV